MRNQWSGVEFEVLENVALWDVQSVITKLFKLDYAWWLKRKLRNCSQARQDKLECFSWFDLRSRPSFRPYVNCISISTVIVATVRLGSRFQSLTLRTNIIANPISTPYQTVLSWLCQRHDYYTAASVALSLLDDTEAVSELGEISKSLEESSYYHMGVLDGIKPLSTDSSREDTSETWFLSLTWRWRVS